MPVGSKHRLRVAVAGAGALGLSSALALARAGCEVTVFDPNMGGANASSVAAGMLAPVFEAVLDESVRPHLGLLLAARNQWAELERQGGVVLERSGALAAGSDAWLERLADTFRGLGVTPTEIGAAALQSLAPGLSPELTRGLLTREDWRLDPVQALTALHAAALSLGVVFRDEVAHGRGDADLLVVATGYGQALAPELAALTPIKGHIVKVEAADVGRITVRGEGAYVAPAPGGFSIGATMEAGRADAVIDPARVEGLKAAGAVLFPRLAGAPGRALTGVRAATPDGLPLVGASVEPGVILAAGARRNGWLLAPLVAQIVAAYATGSDPGAYAALLHPGRFAA